MKYTKYGMLLLLVFTLPTSYADSMRCGNKLISIGDKKAEVLVKCGEPLMQETIAIEEKAEYAQLALKYPLLYKHGMLKKNNDAVIGKESTTTYSIDQWTYHMGQGKFLRILYFEGGELVSIVDGDRM